jgi:hypothetical protein
MALSKIDPDGLNIGQIGGRRNLIINGAMQVAQRGTSATGISTNTYVTCDRWQQIFSGAGAWTATQASDAPDGFVKSQKYTCTTADTATDAGDYFIIRQKIEAQDLQHLKYGTSDAQQLTLSFWVKSSVTGTANATLHGDACSGGVDIICQNFTINTADTWEYKTLTFAGNTNSDGNLTSSNGIGISLWLWFKAGSTWSGGTATGNAWVDNANNRQAVGTNMNISSAVNNVVAITGVQLEVGDTATPFEHRSYGEELQSCLRYFWQITGASGNKDNFAIGMCHNTTQLFTQVHFPVAMRIEPTTVAEFDLQAVVAATGYNVSFNSVSDMHEYGGRVTFDADSGTWTAGNAGIVRVSDSASSYISFDAEL